MIMRSNNVSREFGELKASLTVVEYFEGEKYVHLLENIARVDGNVRQNAISTDSERTNVKNLMLK